MEKVVSSTIALYSFVPVAGYDIYQTLTNVWETEHCAPVAKLSTVNNLSFHSSPPALLQLSSINTVMDNWFRQITVADESTCLRDKVARVAQTAARKTSELTPWPLRHFLNYRSTTTTR